MERERSSQQKDPRGWIILEPFVFCIQFECKGLYLLLALRHGNLDAYVRCRAHAQKIGSREAECMLARFG